jgi:hypothetical protein
MEYIISVLKLRFAPGFKGTITTYSLFRLLFIQESVRKYFLEAIIIFSSGPITFQVGNIASDALAPIR